MYSNEFLLRYAIEPSNALLEKKNVQTCVVLRSGSKGSHCNLTLIGYLKHQYFLHVLYVLTININICSIPYEI